MKLLKHKENIVDRGFPAGRCRRRRRALAPPEIQPGDNVEEPVGPPHIHILPISILLGCRYWTHVFSPLWLNTIPPRPECCRRGTLLNFRGVVAGGPSTLLPFVNPRRTIHRADARSTRFAYPLPLERHPGEDEILPLFSKVMTLRNKLQGVACPLRRVCGERQTSKAW